MKSKKELRNSIVDYYSNPYFGIIYNLKIHGGEGHGKKGLGGRYKFCAAYLVPSDNFTASLECYCEDENIPYWHGKTIDELIENITNDENLVERVTTYKKQNKLKTNKKEKNEFKSEF